MGEKHAERRDDGLMGMLPAQQQPMKSIQTQLHGHEQERNAEVMDGFFETLDKIVILFQMRLKHASSDELNNQWKTRADMIKAHPQSQTTWTLFRMYPNSVDAEVKAFCSKVSAQLAQYRG
ncbi:MAG: hypothetical protein SGPRY_007732 [Prymnesium sp.]